MPKPTIAAINGFALGGGCELAAACDIRYASSRAKLGQPEINLGIIPGWGGTQRLARLCGLGFAKELILTGRPVEADEALARGLVDGVHDPVLDKALETARLLATKSPLALAAAKRALNHALQGDHVANLEREYTEFGGLFASAGRQGGADRLHREARADLQPVGEVRASVSRTSGPTRTRGSRCVSRRRPSRRGGTASSSGTTSRSCGGRRPRIRG